jgi:hypothetical protein
MGLLAIVGSDNEWARILKRKKVGFFVLVWLIYIKRGKKRKMRQCFYLFNG